MPTSISEPAAKGRKSTGLDQWVRDEAARFGFNACGFTTPGAIPEAAARLSEFLGAGRHAGMAWLNERAEARGNPGLLWPDAKSVIMLAMSYGPDHDPLSILAKPDKGAISVYAQNRDYHDLMKGRLKTMASRLGARAKAQVKVFVDTAPVMEKPLAMAAGLGWQGKHTNLVSRQHGSWLFLGAIFTTATLPPDEPETDHCGTCRSCLDICPTSAFPAPYKLDAGRCISYLTIEHDGPIPNEFRMAIGNRIYGCDDCLAVCPWNKFAAAAREAGLKSRPEMVEPDLGFLIGLDDAAFRTFFAGSPVKRIGRERFLRNVLIAAGNSGKAELVPATERLLADPSPIVRGAAVWALSRLLPSAAFSALAQAAAIGENQPDVAAEWAMAMEDLPQ